ncbi:MAG: ribosome small subunit-dependent GTPase A [Clostridiales Family XIII bacterium]|nr:ribosome small subunit-dependent GTPase A [Clostridiales Family XIII bacterium]
MTEGLIVKALSGFYYVEAFEDGKAAGNARAGCAPTVYQCRARGLFKKEGATRVTPLVGDRVRFDVTDEKDAEGYVTEILPRRNAFIRPPVANVEVFLVTVAAKDPDPNPELTDRFLVSAEAADAEAVVVVNKDDLSPAAARKMAQIYRGVYPVAVVSAQTREGTDALWEMIKGRTVAFAGASGVGKTSLLACWAEDLAASMETGEVSRKTGRGKHTTRHVEIFRCADGTLLFDTPGFSAFEPAEAANLAAGRMDMLFPEFLPYLGGCRFDNCSHTHEPGCAVRAALEAGKIRQTRYGSYVKVLEEVEKWQNYHHQS